MASNVNWNRDRPVLASVCHFPHIDPMISSLVNSLTDLLTAIDCVNVKKSKYVPRYAVQYCSKYYKYLEGFAISSNLNLV